MFKNLPHYLALMRFDRPIGWLLLLWPTMWALWIASDGQPSGRLIWLFALGVIVMRSAGCVINDYADKEIDPAVARTVDRPLASGALTGKQALIFFVFLCAIALILLLQLPSRVWPWAIPAAAITIFYPYAKRFFVAPQMVLGLAFSLGVPMVYVTLDQQFDSVFYLLMLSNFLWVVVYDTAYAMSDREDDLKIGIKSTAILFGKHDKLVLAVLQIAIIALLCVLAMQLHLGRSFYFGLLIASALFIYQQRLIADRGREQCFQAFLNNGWLGGIIWFGLLGAF